LTNLNRHPDILQEFLSARTAAQVESGLRRHLILKKQD